MHADAKLSSLVVLLHDWADWMGRHSHRLGYPSKALALSSGYSSTSFEDLCEAVDAITLRSIDAAISDLAPDQSSAIQHRYLHSAYRFADYPTALDLAHEKLTVTLPRKGVHL